MPGMPMSTTATSGRSWLEQRQCGLAISGLIDDVSIGLQDDRVHRAGVGMIVHQHDASGWPLGVRSCIGPRRGRRYSGESHRERRSATLTLALRLDRSAMQLDQAPNQSESDAKSAL